MTKFSKSFIIIAIAVLAVVWAGDVAWAQFYFGKNKVQYTDFQWQVMSTDHFKIYFYKNADELAEIAARSAEESYKVLAAKFDHEIYSPIPLIIYSNPNHFVQTNVTYSHLPENVAGFTEFIKGRVVIPFNGSFNDFDRVIRHELVHVFTVSKITRAAKECGGLSIPFPPLWFVEGIAECWSREWDSETDLIIRDMVIDGRLPSIEQFSAYQGSYFMYKLGETVCNFIEINYGKDKITRLFDNWGKGRSFDEIVEFTLGDNMAAVSKKWSYYLKKRYYPQITTLDMPDRKAKKLTQQQFAVRPVPVMLTDKDGNEEQWIIYKANKSGYSAIYMMPANGDQSRVVTLLKGELSAKFESLHLLQSGIDQFDNRFLIFSSKSRERDVLYLYDLEKRSVTHKYEFEELVAISSPRFSLDGKQVVFTGHRFNGYADLYLLNLADGGLSRLTSDIYNDLDPCFSAEGDAVVFSSDRGTEGFKGFTSLFRLDIGSGVIDRLTYGRYHDRGPSSAPDGSGIIFYSDRGEGQAINIFKVNNDGSVAQLTSYITGAYDPRYGSSPDEIYFHAYQNLGFHLFKTKIENPEPLADLPDANINGKWIPGKIDANARSTTVNYKTDYSLDIAQSTLAYDGVYGTLGGVQAAFSDMLGNHTIVFLLTNTARNKDDFFTSFNGAVTYLYRANRINWGVGGFHFYDEYYNDYDGYYFERLIGGVAYASYPLSKFNRFEASVFVRHSDRDAAIPTRDRKAFLATPLLSYVIDNSLWESTGPIEGHRFNFTVGYTYDFNTSRAFNRLGSIDLRQYLRIGRLSAVASRVFAYSSAGIEPQRIYFGGSWNFRGFGRRHFYNRNILFNSEELRFPLLNDLILGFPFGNLRFRGFRGAIFHDVGTAWDDRWKGWEGSFGVSVRVAIGYLVVLRLDVSRTHDFKRISDNTRTDFFFGWNF